MDEVTDSDDGLGEELEEWDVHPSSPRADSSKAAGLPGLNRATTILGSGVTAYVTLDECRTKGADFCEARAATVTAASAGAAWLGATGGAYLGTVCGPGPLVCSPILAGLGALTFGLIGYEVSSDLTDPNN